jgi:hypothetical protein
VDKAARAGCFQNFMGMESLNPKSLLRAQKRQNRPEDYAEMLEMWRARGVVTQVGYIIGFPEDSYDSVIQDIHALKTMVKPDLASFFVLTPFPGSADHLALWKAGVPLPDDMNSYDATHAIVAHEKMSGEEWTRAYRGAWESFYSYDNLRAILQRVHPRAYESVFGALLWYRQAALLQGKHPLAAGFWRKRDRGSRRPGFPRETWLGARSGTICPRRGARCRWPRRRCACCSRLARAERRGRCPSLRIKLDCRAPPGSTGVRPSGSSGWRPRGRAGSGGNRPRRICR